MREDDPHARARSWLVLVLPAAMLLLPLLGLVELSLGVPTGAGMVGLAAVLRSTAWSLGYGLGLGVAATALALPVARVVPVPLLVGTALVHPLARALGVLGTGLVPGATAAAIALVSGAIPLAALVLRLRLRARPLAWLDAAADLGASTAMRWWWIELPHLRPALTAAVAWVTLQILGDVTVLRLAGGGKVYGPALLARDALLRDGAPVRALVVVGVLLVVAAGLSLRLARELRSVPGGADRRRAPASAMERGLGWGLWLTSSGPLVGLVGGALHPATDPSGGERLLERLGPTVALALAVAILATAIGFVMVLALRRHAPRGPVAAIVLPVALPSSVLGMLWLSVAQWAGAGPSDGLTALALLAPAIALSFLVALLMLRAVPPALPRSAADLGAGPRARLAWLWWPLSRRPLAIAALVTFAWVVCEASIPAFTAGPGGTTLTMGLLAVARSGDVATLHRWCLGLALVPMATAIAWHTAAWWMARRGARR